MANIFTGCLFRLALAIACFGATLGCLPQAAAARIIVPVMVGYSSISATGSTSPSGITRIPTTGNYAMVDSNLDMVFMLSQAGEILDMFSTLPHSTAATGITFVTSTEHLAIVDSSADEIFYFDLEGNYVSQCDIAVLNGTTGSTNPQGIGYMPATNQIAIADTASDEFIIVDLTGNLVDRKDISDDCNDPRGITITTGGNLAIIDAADDEVYIYDLTGTLLEQFDTAWVAGSSAGLTLDETTGNLIMVDYTLSMIFVIDYSGEYLRSFDTYGIGAAEPVGISHIADTDTYAIVDRNGLEMYIVNTGGDLLHHCDMSSFSTTLSPRGITHISATGIFAVVDDYNDEIYVMNADCQLLYQMDISVFGINASAPTGIEYLPELDKLSVTDSIKDSLIFIEMQPPPKLARHLGLSMGGLTSPQDVARIPDNGNLAIIDNGADKVFVFNTNGVLKALFPTNPFSLNPQGIAYNALTQEVAILETTGQEVMILSLPALVFSPSRCEGDLDLDGDVDGPDLAVFAAGFGRGDCQ